MANAEAHKKQPLSSQDTLLAYLAEYLDGELTPELKAQVDALIKTPGQQDIPAHFQAMRGRLQLSLQSYYLKDDEISALKSYVQDPAVKATQENAKIEALGRGEVVSTLLRRLALIAIAVAAVAFGVWKFGPRREATFKPLEFLGYEALALEEDPRDRLDLPSGDMKEIRQYLAAYPGLEFKPKVMKTMPADWKPEGATIIDYEIAKVALVQFASTTSKEKLFHFSYAGELKDLPPAEPGNMRGLIFQTYSSDDLNLVAFEGPKGVVSILAGRRSAPELAEMALNGTK